MNIFEEPIVYLLYINIIFIIYNLDYCALFSNRVSPKR